MAALKRYRLWMGMAGSVFSPLPGGEERVRGGCGGLACAGPALRRRSGRDGPGTAVVVLPADDVVLPQVRPMLDLDQHDRHAAGILDAVPGASGDVHRAPRLEPLRAARNDDPRRAGDDHPVLGPEAMPLQAQPLAGLDEEPLDLVAVAFRDGEETAPGARLVDAHRGLAPPHTGGLHSRIIRTKSASTLLLTSSMTSGDTSSSSSSTTMARPRRVRRPTCIEAMLTLWRPRIEPMRPTMPGRSS